MRVVIAPDSFGGTLSPVEATEAIASGWSQEVDDDLVLVPLADGGEGSLEALARQGGTVHEVEVADPLGRPTVARWLERPDGSAFVESAEGCGLSLLSRDQRDPLKTTTYGVGQLLEAVRERGIRQVAVGLGGSATVDGGSGAALALGLRVTCDDGNGVKIGGGNLTAVARVEPRWLDPGWRDVRVAAWADVDTVLGDAAARFGPQKGAGPDAIVRLDNGLTTWADVVERDLGGVWRGRSGTGAAGGLGFGLMATLGADFVRGAPAMGAAVGLPGHLTDAELVVTGEGTLDATTRAGKVVGYVLEEARRRGLGVVAVTGRAAEAVPGLVDVEEAAPGGPGSVPADDVRAAATRLAARVARGR